MDHGFAPGLLKKGSTFEPALPMEAYEYGVLDGYYVDTPYQYILRTRTSSSDDYRARVSATARGKPMLARGGGPSVLRARVSVRVRVRTSTSTYQYQ